MSPARPAPAAPRITVEHGGGRLAVGAGEVVLVGAEAAAAYRGVAPGAVHLDGRPVTSLSAARRVRAGLAALGPVEVADEVSVRDHLVAVPRSRSERVDELLAEAPLLAGRGDDPAGWLSGGERQVLGWLQARLLAPRAILLDGAGRGLDPSALDWAAGVVRAWLGSGTAVLVRPGRPQERSWGALEA